MDSETNNVSNVTQEPTPTRSTIVPQDVIPIMNTTVSQLQSPMVDFVNYAERP